MARRTKIICTLGPASESPATLRSMIDAGMDVARLAMAHGGVDEGLDRLRRVRQAADEAGRPVGVMVDLAGPKLRSGTYGDRGVMLAADTTISIRSSGEPSTATVMHVDHESLDGLVALGDTLLAGDGGVTLQVEEADGDGFTARVVHGGNLRGRAGIRLPADRLSQRAPTAQDMAVLDAFLDADVDMVALSFVRSGSDVRRLGTEPHPTGPLVIAKIENLAAVEHLDGIIEESGAIMVARGDLGAEASLAELPHLQKEIIERCIAGGLPVVTATQMLETMITAPAPTRAEASDVANAIFDGTSAVMLSAETAIGAHPITTVKTMAQIAAVADQRFDHRAWTERLERLHLNTRTDASAAVTDAMTSAAARAAESLDIKAMLCISNSGFTVRSMARFRTRAQILGLTPNPATLRQLTSSWGTIPIEFDSAGSWEAKVDAAVAKAKAEGHIEQGDLVGVLAGTDSTDVFRLLTVR